MMTDTQTNPASSNASANNATNDTQDILDVLIIGAGVSGIGAAYHLQTKCPERRYAIIEARGDIGGTWDLFRYPGIRSDSDLFTFGYDFKPWDSANGIADAPAIKAYLAETVRENMIDAHIRFRRKALSAEWCSQTRGWTIRVRNTESDEETTIRARWIFAASGYYNYDEGFTPEFAGRERFRGIIVHPQQWPEHLDYRGKRVVVIGSGATAVTLVPAMANKAMHVTMLQRTPSYVMPIPLQDPVAKIARPIFGRRIAHSLARSYNIAKQRWFFAYCQRFPNSARKLIRYVNKKALPKGYDVDRHFSPPYNPWDQRLCAVPDGDLFKVLSDGRASIVTDRIKHFTESGIALESGAHLDADLIVTATGLKLNPIGGLQVFIDGKRALPTDAVTFKGMMLSNVPNFAFAVGYTASSWTLKIGLICEHFCRLLNHMRENALDVCTPMREPDMQTQPMINFGAGYVQRSLAELPRQGDRYPWQMSWNYAEDVKIFRRGEIADKHLKFLPRE
jgi:monooxygenase